MSDALAELKGRVLLVDGDGGASRALVASLREAFDLDACETHAAAVGLLATSAYEVLLTTYRLPDGNGLDLIDHALDAHPNLSAILLTGVSEQVETTLEKHAGRFVVLSHPIAPDAVLSWVENNAANTRLVRILRKIAGRSEDSGSSTREA